MAARPESTRQRLIKAAIHLFVTQGVTETTTKQIAELAGVNEVTLFRHFGNKHGLLLAVLEDTQVFTQLVTTLRQQASQTSSVAHALQNYASIHIQALAQIQEFVRSLIGEAGQYPIENRQALGRSLTLANRYTAQYLATVIRHEQLRTNLPTEKLASLLNSLLLGYAVLEFTSEVNELWQDRDHFISDLVELFLYGAVSRTDAISIPVNRSLAESRPSSPAREIVDLPASIVHTLLKQARKAGTQDYAIAYVLFASGLSPAEMVALQRSSSIVNDHQHVLQISQGNVRQVPLNQWISGKRYGSHPQNPLTRWLKTRKDQRAPLFLDESGQALSEADVRSRWQIWTEGIVTPQGQPPAIEQAHQTWCIEMLMKGITLEELSILTGQPMTELQPYARRAREKVALEQATRLDQKLPNGAKPLPVPSRLEGGMPDIVAET